MSWRVMVNVDKEWTGNALRFEIKSEAEAYARDLYRRWTAVKTFKLVETEDAPNANFPLRQTQTDDNFKGQGEL